MLRSKKSVLRPDKDDYLVCFKKHRGKFEQIASSKYLRGQIEFSRGVIVHAVILGKLTSAQGTLGIAPQAYPAAWVRTAQGWRMVTILRCRIRPVACRCEMSACSPDAGSFSDRKRRVPPATEIARPSSKRDPRPSRVHRICPMALSTVIGKSIGMQLGAAIPVAGRWAGDGGCFGTITATRR